MSFIGNILEINIWLIKASTVTDLRNCFPGSFIIWSFSWNYLIFIYPTLSKNLHFKVILWTLYPYLITFIFWNSKESTGFITECPTQWLSFSPLFRNICFRLIIFFVLSLFGMQYSCFSINLELSIFPMVKRYVQLALYVVFLFLFLVIIMWLIYSRFRIMHNVQLPFTFNISQKYLAVPLEVINICGRFYLSLVLVLSYCLERYSNAMKYYLLISLTQRIWIK